MGSSKPHAAEAWARLASGIEAGIVGGLAMLGILLSDSLWDGHVWWEVPNLLGSTFYGPRAFRSGPGMATLSGLAFHLVITGTLGGLFGLAFGGIQQRGRLILLGLLVSAGWYNLANVAFWPKVNPWVLVASPRPATLVSHVLLGACLGFMGQRHRGQRHGLAPLEGSGFLASPAGLAPPSYVTPLGQIASSIDLPHPQESSADNGAGSANGAAGGADEEVTADLGQPPAAASSDALE
jgi:hypothetical protein